MFARVYMFAQLLRFSRGVRTARGRHLSGESRDEKLNAIKRKVSAAFGTSPLSLPPLLAEFKFKLGLWGKIASRHKISCMANFNPFKLCSALSRAEYHLIILTKHLLRIPYFPSSLLFFFSCSIRYTLFFNRMFLFLKIHRATYESRNITIDQFFWGHFYCIL